MNAHSTLSLSEKASFTTEAQAQLLTPEALAFLQALEAEFGKRRQQLLAARAERQKRLDAGELYDFLPETAHIRAGDWHVAPAPADLTDRRVEITGPVDRKMVINALNSGARVFMADFEDSNTPTWSNQLEGQKNLYDAVRRTISLETAEGKRYELKEKTATLVVRPRGWHLDEKHVKFLGKPMSGSLFDFGLYFFHNAKELIRRGSGPYFYLPKLESHHEARLWNEVFVFSQRYLGIPEGTVRATVLIETLPAAFEMEEILYELRHHAGGLNCGRWDYIFSYIKKLSAHKDRVLPERGQVTMTTHFLRSYAQLVIETCHKRGAFAMGGMSAYIPVKGDEEANAKALAAVHADKLREASYGHDGTWVAHPGLVPVAMEVFDGILKGPNQLSKRIPDLKVTAEDLLRVPEGTVTEAGVRNNLEVAIRYMEAWLRGQGCVPLFNLMEDAATAEISRAQIWQWLHNGQVRLADGRAFTEGLYEQLLGELKIRLQAEVTGDFEASTMGRAVLLFDRLVRTPRFTEFLTVPAYEEIA